MLWLTENDTGRNLETVLKETTRDNKGWPDAQNARGVEAMRALTSGSGHTEGVEHCRVNAICKPWVGRHPTTKKRKALGPSSELDDKQWPVLHSALLVSE